jgi:hypothetical protein
MEMQRVIKSKINDIVSLFKGLSLSLPKGESEKDFGSQPYERVSARPPRRDIRKRGSRTSPPDPSFTLTLGPSPIEGEGELKGVRS